MKIADRWRIALFAITISAISFNIWFFRPRQTEEKPPTRDGDVPDIIPPDGWCMNQRFKGVKLNPDMLDKRLNNLYKEMELYKSRKGSYPDGELELNKDMRENPSVYGYKSGFEGYKKMAMRNQIPDMKYSDSHFRDSSGTITAPYYLIQRRPDGTNNGTPHSPRTRDVLAYSDIYFYQDSCILPNGKTNNNPTGFYMVLWDDGEVSKIPYDKVRFVYPQLAGSPAQCFPGQTGVPSTTYTQSEMLARLSRLQSDCNNPNVVPIAK